MSGEHTHQDLATKEELAAVATASAADVADLATEVAALANRVAALEDGDTTPPPEPENDHPWSSDYSTDPWWSNYGIISSDQPEAHDMATTVIDDPFNQFDRALQVECLPGTSLDTGGCCYGFTDRCSFERMGLCSSDHQGINEFTWEGMFALPDDWCETEDDWRWRNKTGSGKLPFTFGTYDPNRGAGSQPYSNNFAALEWAASVGAIFKGPNGSENYDRNLTRPSTFFAVSRAGGHTRKPVPNGQQVSMIQFYWHLNPDPNAITSGLGTSSKPYITMARGEWHEVKVYARANTAGQANGEYKAWFDGDLAMWITDLQLMPSIARGFNIWHNQWFHGGPEGNDTPQTSYLGPVAFLGK